MALENEISQECQHQAVVKRMASVATQTCISFPSHALGRSQLATLGKYLNSLNIRIHMIQQGWIMPPASGVIVLYWQLYIILGSYNNLAK